MQLCLYIAIMPLEKNTTTPINNLFQNIFWWTLQMFRNTYILDWVLIDQTRSKPDDTGTANWCYILYTRPTLDVPVPTFRSVRITVLVTTLRAMLRERQDAHIVVYVRKGRKWNFLKMHLLKIIRYNEMYLQTNANSEEINMWQKVVNWLVSYAVTEKALSAFFLLCSLICRYVFL